MVLCLAMSTNASFFIRKHSLSVSNITKVEEAACPDNQTDSTQKPRHLSPRERHLQAIKDKKEHKVNDKKHQKFGLSTASLACGVASVLFFESGLEAATVVAAFVSCSVFALAAIVIGIIALHKKQQKGMAKGGIIIGCVMLGLLVLGMTIALISVGFI
jgi:lipopolysaccharide export LptBFGC system permease protein LptF